MYTFTVAEKNTQHLPTNQNPSFNNSVQDITQLPFAFDFSSNITTAMFCMLHIFPTWKEV